MNGTGLSGCVYVETAVIGASLGYQTTVFNVVVAVVLVCAVLFLFASLFWLARWTFFSAYLGVTLFAAYTLLLTLVQKLLPVVTPASSRVWADFSFALYVLILSLQWAVQSAVAMLLLADRPDAAAVRWTAGLALAWTVLLLAPWVAGAATGAWAAGQLVTECLLCAFFAAALLLCSARVRRVVPLGHRLAPRPAAAPWVAYMLLIHCTFLAASVVRTAAPGSQAGSCAYLVVDLTYYVLYGPALALALVRDSRQWGKEGLLLAQSDSNDKL